MTAFLLENLEGLATAASIVFATIIGVWQLRRQAQVRLEEYTLDFVSQEQTTESLQRALVLIYKGIREGANSAELMEDETYFNAFIIVLSYYTTIAISTKNKLLLDDVIYNNMGAAIIRNFDFLRPFIVRMREEIGFPRYCGTLEELVENDLRPQSKRLQRPIEIKGAA